MNIVADIKHTLLHPSNFVNMATVTPEQVIELKKAFTLELSFISVRGQVIEWIFQV